MRTSCLHAVHRDRFFMETAKRIPIGMVSLEPKARTDYRSPNRGDVFSKAGQISSANLIRMLLLRAGDIESNPGVMPAPKNYDKINLIYSVASVQILVTNRRNAAVFLERHKLELCGNVHLAYKVHPLCVNPPPM